MTQKSDLEQLKESLAGFSKDVVRDAAACEFMTSLRHPLYVASKDFVLATGGFGSDDHRGHVR